MSSKHTPLCMHSFAHQKLTVTQSLWFLIDVCPKLQTLHCGPTVYDNNPKIPPLHGGLLYKIDIMQKG